MHARRSLPLPLTATLAIASCAAPAPRTPAAPPRRPIPLEQASALLAPVRLEAGGRPIDVGELIGYAGPAVADLDGDGLQDLLVGTFSGKILVHRNVGTPTQPVFAEGTFLQADGADLEISNW